MRVFEHDQHRVVAGEPIDHGREACLDLMDESGLVPALARPEEQTETLRSPGRRRRVGGPGCQLAETIVDRVGAVARPEGGEVGDDRGRRREGGGIGLGPRLPAEDHDRRADARRELIRQPRLADAGLADDRDQDWSAGRAGQAKALAEDRLLAGPADEWDRAPSRAGGDLIHRKCFQGRIETLGPDPPSPAVGDIGGGQQLRRLADQHLPRLGCRLQARGGVDHRPCDEQLASRRAAHRGLAGLDPNSNLQGQIQAELAAQPPHSFPDCQARPDRAQGVVLVHMRQTEHRHHRIADELLRPASEGGQLVGGRVEEAAEQLARTFGVEPLRQACRIDNVGEEDCHHLALFGFDQRSRRGAAVGTVPRTLGNRQPAHRARPDHVSRICCIRWPTPSSRP